MLIAKLTVSVGNSGIAYNKPEEIKTEIGRGSVLESGAVIRGLGTHFANQEAKVRYDKLVSRANEIRNEFATRFGRAFLMSTFVLSTPGEGYEFAKRYEGDAPDIIVTISELNLEGELGEREIAEWATTYKDQLKRIPLGRAEEADEEGLAALESLAKCPILKQETKDAILRMVSEVRIGKMKRVDLKRGISLLRVAIEPAPLMAPRGRPTVDSATPA
jgi:hypothetical protein